MHTFNETQDLPLFAAVEARDRAMAQVEGAADDAWKAAALDAVRRAALAMPDFIVDQVWAFIPAGVSTHDSRAMGPVIMAAKKAGIIEASDAFRPSPRRHASPQRVWRSLIHPHHQEPHV